MRVSENGRELDATFSVERDGQELSVIFESRGGRIGSAGAKNTEYSAGLDLVICRLCKMAARLTDVVLDTKTTQAAGSSRAARRLALKSWKYPIELRNLEQKDVSRLRLEISRSQGETGRTPTAKGYGNGTKRIRLYVEFPDARGEPEEIAHALASGLANEIARLHSTRLDDEAAAPEPITEYLPTDGDFRESVNRDILARRGQKKFRDALAKRYGWLCMISGATTKAVLEAAHIRPYRGPNDNHPSNGLLLRADLHTLFDVNLLGIEPESLRIRVAKRVMDLEYRSCDGKTLVCESSARPSPEALQARWALFLQPAT
jgi:hypothetical protein